MIRLLIIEDHPVAVSGLKNMFRAGRDGIEVAHCTSTVESAQRSVPDDQFDIVVLDLYIAETDPICNIKNLVISFPLKPVVVFTSEESMEWQRKMFDNGARAYIMKSAPRKEIADIIQKVYDKKIVLPDFIRHENIGRIVSVTDRSLNSLTLTQRTIILELASGKSYKEIAASRKTTISNIEKTMMHLRNKMGAKTNVELIAILYGQ